jgi:hypothetical protein
MMRAMPQAALFAQNMPVKGMGMPVRPGMEDSEEDSEEDSDGDGLEAAPVEEALFGAAPAAPMQQQELAVKDAVEEEAGFKIGESAFKTTCCHTRWLTRRMALPLGGRSVRKEREETERFAPGSRLPEVSCIPDPAAFRLTQDAEQSAGALNNPHI